MATRRLATYRAKRDFSKTREPSGQRKVARADHLRFVIQKHAARRLHYDLRLELDGVFKSWAVTREPSLDPRVKRLAVEVEDHPLDYGDFEGTIPQGQYGGGTVQLWDRGYWRPEGERSVPEMLRDGTLRFKLEGTRLTGDWVLVRMRDDRGSRRHNCLLIKRHDVSDPAGNGHDALPEDRSVASGRTMSDIAAGKGRKPRPFMLKDSAYQSDAVWNSNRDTEADMRSTAGATARRAPKQLRAPVVMGVPISNPAKALWPATAAAEAITKLELARYYEAVGPRLLAAGRRAFCAGNAEGRHSQIQAWRYATQGRMGVGPHAQRPRRSPAQLAVDKAP